MTTLISFLHFCIYVRHFRKLVKMKCKKIIFMQKFFWNLGNIFHNTHFHEKEDRMWPYMGIHSGLLLSPIVPPHHELNQIHNWLLPFGNQWLEDFSLCLIFLLHDSAFHINKINIKIKKEKESWALVEHMFYVSGLVLRRYSHRHSIHTNFIFLRDQVKDKHTGRELLSVCPLPQMLEPAGTVPGQHWEPWTQSRPLMRVAGSQLLEPSVPPLRVCTGRKREPGVGTGIKPTCSDLGCRYLTGHLNCWSKCLSPTNFGGSNYCHILLMTPSDSNNIVTSAN